MADALGAQIEKLAASLAALQAQRALVGDVLDPAIAATRQQLDTLQSQQRTLAPPPVQERRLITILFTDVVGSTALAEKLDPEDWRETVAQLHSTVGNLIAQHQGTVAQYLGDGLLAFFGAQESGEQDAEHAIRAALEFQNAIAVGAGLKPAPTPIRIRVGIHTGLVIVGELGADSHKEFTATGDAMNLAARLQSAAPPGGVLISGETYRYVRGVFNVTPQPPLTVKGKSEPIATFLVRRAKARAFRVASRGVLGIQTRTIGRDPEFKQLRDAYLDAFENNRLVWAQLMGEPGVGKSRLVQDMDDWIELRAESVRGLRGRAFAGEQNQPFALVRRMWFDRFRIADDAPLAQAEAKWVEGFRELTGIVQEEPAHALGLLIGLPFADSPHIGEMRNDPTQVKGRGFVVSKQALHAIRATQPLRLLLEDLHWADESSLEYLQQVVMDENRQGDKESAQHGMFVLATARTEWKLPEGLISANQPQRAGVEESSSVVGRPLTILIPLVPLTAAATRELAQDLLQNVIDAPASLIDLIVERSEGVPYFAEELINWFIDRGVIDHNTNPWRFVEGRLQQAPLPATLHYLLRARLDTLKVHERAALQCGAIFGRNFWTGGVEALGAPQSNVVLQQLQPRGFIEAQPVSALDDDSEWTFHHALLRDVTYESILKSERGSLHKKASEWLEAKATEAGRLDEFAGLLGEHTERGGDSNTAAEWYVLAGERATAQGATREARNFFDRALTLLPAEAPEQRWRALSGHERMLVILGEKVQGQADVNALLTLADELGDEGRRAEALFRQADSAFRAGEFRPSADASEQAVAAAQRAGNQPLALRARSELAFALGRLGVWQSATQLAQDVIAQARTLGDDAALTYALGHTGSVLAALGDLARGAELQKEAGEAAQRCGDRYRAAMSLTNLGYNFLQLGLYKQGRATIEQALALNEAIGARQSRAYALQNLGLAYFRLGDGRAARRVLDESIRELTVLGDAFGRAAGILYLACELDRSGDLAGAAQRYQEGAEGFSAIGAHGYANDARAGWARCAFGQGQLENAKIYATEIWQYLSEHGTAGMEFPVWVYLTCADIFDALGDFENSRTTVKLGYRELMTRAEKISNIEWRRSYMENVPEHRAMIELWERNS